MTVPRPHDASLLHAEDFSIGEVFHMGTRALSAEEIVAFAREWDPQPFHLSEEAARSSVFGGLAASGLHSIAVIVRMGSDHLMGRTAVIAGRSWQDVRLRKPVRPDMRLHGRATVEAIEPRDERRALVRWLFELRDDTDDLVTSFVGEAVVHRR